MVDELELQSDSQALADREALLQDILNQSVQAQSDPQTSHMMGMFPNTTMLETQIWDGGMLFQVGEVADYIPKWSIYPALRDRYLRRFFRTEPMITGAVYSLMARLGALDYRLTGIDDLQDDIELMLQESDFGAGLRSLIKKTVEDLLTQDNGAFWELIGMGSPEQPLFAGVPFGVNHLDSAQCWRTFDPEYPVLYVNPITGKFHRLHRTRIVTLSNMEQANELARGVGYCAVSRVLLQSQLMRAIMQYRYEKASGKFDRAIGYGTGLTMKTLSRLMQATQTQDDSEGLVRVGRIPFFLSMKEITLNLLDLASIPDGFNLNDEVMTYVQILALCFGVDTREFWSATQSGATKADASIQNMKAQAKGLADLITTIQDALNKYVIPAGMTFEFDFVDDEHDRQVETQNQVTVGYLTEIKNSGGITDRQYQAMLIHKGILDENVLMEADTITQYTMEEVEPEPVPELLTVPSDAIETQETLPFTQESTQEALKLLKRLKIAKVSHHAIQAIFREKASQTTYEAALISTGRGLFYKDLSYNDSVMSFDSVIRRGFMQAWMTGAAAAGVSREELSDAERTALQTRIVQEQEYVIPLADWIVSESERENPSFQKVMDRLAIWANRWGEVAAKAKLMASANKKFEWVFNPKKEHCVDCAKLNGRVYRGSIWDKYNIRPRSAELACFGGHCGCDLKETTRPATPGKPPALSNSRQILPV